MKKNDEGKIKSLAKMAKNRLRTGFWESYREDMHKKVKMAEEEGMGTSNIINYYKIKAEQSVNPVNVLRKVGKFKTKTEIYHAFVFVKEASV